LALVDSWVDAVLAGDDAVGQETANVAPAGDDAVGQETANVAPAGEGADPRAPAQFAATVDALLGVKL
jgi:hypothetical protein